MTHFRKVSKSYWRGLFCCYDVADLPRTNNDLERLFGSNRYHERRATGRRNASPAMVLRGPVRLIAATATRLSPATPMELAPANLDRWRLLRAQLEERRHARVLRSRFRRNPAGYLRQLEDQLLKPILDASRDASRPADDRAGRQRRLLRRGRAQPQGAVSPPGQQ
jgi:hypothetical protein